MAQTKGRPQRLERIRELVVDRPLRSQHELRAALAKMNVHVDQSTLSRDLAELAIRKIDGRYRLTDPRERPEPSRYLADAVHGWTVCGPHLIVLRVAVGQAQAIGVAIDRSDEPSIAGVLAGDDTLFIAIRSGGQQQIALRRLERWFGDKHGGQA